MIAENVSPGWFAVATAAIMTFPPSVNAFVNLWIAKGAKQDAKKASDQQDKILVLADKTHTLVNSQHGIALATVYEQALRIAKLTGDPVDAAKAEEARKKLSEHETKQNAVDLKQGGK